MTIWILTLVLLASLAALGYRQGAIRVAFSFVGIIVAALLAVPLGHVLSPLISKIGVKEPMLLWLLPPAIVYAVVLTLFKVAGAVTHKKVEVFYKYKGGDLRNVLWERLNRRLGLCLGLANGAAYLVLICFVIYAFSYWTVQLESPDSNPKIVEIFNRMGKDLENTGMAKVAGSISHMPDSYYEAADVIGLIYQNPRVQPRLALYPPLLSLGERPEFQAVANDTALAELRQKQAAIREMMDNPSVKAILKNPETLNVISNTLVPNLKDLNAFLHTGKSETFSEKILGRWDFNVNSAITGYRRLNPNMTPTQMQALRLWINTSFADTTLIATPDQQAFLKNFPQLQQPAPRNAPGRNPPAAPPATAENLQGKWQGSEGKYDLIFSMSGISENLSAVVEGDRLTINSPGSILVFDREN